MSSGFLQLPLGTPTSLPTGTPTISSPVVKKVFQRDNTNKASVTVSGSANYLWTQVQARAVSITGGATTEWHVIATQSNPASGSFSGSFTVTGGWYRLDIQTLYYSQPTGNASLATFGVGEIFVVGGQSLTACNNEGLNTSTDPRSLMVDLSGNYTQCADPMTIQSASQGSLWPALTDLLTAAINVPVVVANTGLGGTLISEWQPGTTNYNTLLKPTIQLFPANGFRAVLWGHGETDAGAGTSTANYQGTAGVNGLRNVVSQSKTDAGWNIPWGVNIESAGDGVTPTPAIATAQANVAGDTGNFQGVVVDNYLGDPYRWTAHYPHLSVTGENTIAAQWVTVLTTKFGW